MRRTRTATAAAAASALGLAAAALTSSASAASVTGGTPTSHIVVLDDSSAARTVAQAHAERFGLELGHVYSSALQGYSATMTPQTAALVAALPGVDFVQRDRQVSTTAQSTPVGIDRSQADLSPTAAID
ncbi:MAG TPA: protease inhibitor I9 family protein, partial [Nocardioides sp.]|nr:protease inhibitor I9 family protein [Nocardioides sp.]